MFYPYDIYKHTDLILLVLSNVNLKIPIVNCAAT